MKTFLIFLIALVILLSSCEDFLEPNVYDRISGSSFYLTDEDARAAITGLYSYFGNDVTNTDGTRLLMGEYGTDGFVQKDPDFNNLNWETDKGYPFHSAYFRAVPFVTSAGAVIANIEDMDFKNPELKTILTGEARLARAIVAFDLLKWYGPTAIITDKKNLLLPDNNFKPSRPSNEEYTSFLESELLKSIEELPENNDQGHFNKNIAKMVLLKYYMHQKNWDGAATISSQIIGKYELNNNYYDNWNINTENSKELIWSIPRISNNSSFRNVLRMRSSYPVISQVTQETTWGGTGMDKYRFDFRSTFHPNDIRLDSIIDTFYY
ncbi:MAG: RagB/SusD family nutrient uptake outer membrane protein, partial [Bacteroidales bacterium]|nr:RagB/SusD family nutrient uptake outer membrane protein [Bacteroidales bacterium]